MYFDYDRKPTCVDGSRVDFCTLPNEEIGRKLVRCSSSCKYNDPGITTYT
jgi:hypothetical protein